MRNTVISGFEMSQKVLIFKIYTDKLINIYMLKYEKFKFKLIFK